METTENKMEKFQITNYKLQISPNYRNPNDLNKESIVSFGHCLPVRQTGNLKFIRDLMLGARNL